MSLSPTFILPSILNIDWWRSLTVTHNIANNSLIYVRSRVNILCLMSVGNISFILMKSSFTIYTDRQTANRKYTRTNCTQSSGIFLHHHRERKAIGHYLVSESGVWFCTDQGSIEASEGRLGVGAYWGWCPLSGSSFSEYYSTDDWHPHPHPQCWCLHGQQLATRNLYSQRERASLATGITLQPLL